MQKTILDFDVYGFHRKLGKQITIKYFVFKHCPLLKLIIFLVGLTLTSCGLFWRSDAEEVAKNFPIYEGAVLVGKYDTSWPDDNPRVGLAYTSEATVQELTSFYQNEPANQGWQLIEVVDHSDPAATVKVLWENDDWNCRVLIYNQEPRRVEIEISPK